MNKKLGFLLICVFFISLTSCIGLSLDIQLNRNGSGRITMEYRILSSLENLGKLDGNERWPAIPIGRADWERTLARIPGASLASFSSRETGTDIVTSVTINFNNPQTLLAILDPTGAASYLNLETGLFKYIFEQGGPDTQASEFDETLMELARLMFADYNFSFAFTAPSNAAMTITDGQGNPTTAPRTAQIVPSGRRVSMSIGIIDLAETPEGFGVSVRW